MHLLSFLQDESAAISQLVTQDREYLIQEIKNLHNALLQQQDDRKELSDSNEDLKNEISKLEEKLCQWKAENLTPKQKHLEEMANMKEMCEASQNECQELQYVEWFLCFLSSMLSFPLEAEENNN